MIAMEGSSIAMKGMIVTIAGFGVEAIVSIKQLEKIVVVVMQNLQEGWGNIYLKMPLLQELWKLHQHIF